MVGGAGFEPAKVSQRIYSPSSLAAWVSPQVVLENYKVLKQITWASSQIRTDDPEITNHVLWPTELYRQMSKIFRLTNGLQM